MDSSKCSYSPLKDSTIEHKSEKIEENDTLSTREHRLNFFQKYDLVEALSHYRAVLSRTPDEGVTLEDLDPIELQLKKYLSACSVHLRAMHKSQIEYEAHLFWLSVDPYCRHVTKDDISFLDGMIRECSQETNSCIPKLGEAYLASWTGGAGHQEHSNGISKSMKESMYNSEIKKVRYSSPMGAFENPLAQRLLDALLSERTLKSVPKMYQKLSPSDFVESPNGVRNDASVDWRLRKILIEQGIFDEDDEEEEPQDEILLEIRKCESELASVNKYNMNELKKLRATAVQDMRMQEVEAALNKIDKEIVMQLLSNTAPHPSCRLSAADVTNIIKQQVHLSHKLMDLTDFSLMF